MITAVTVSALQDKPGAQFLNLVFKFLPVVQLATDVETV